ncbi:complement receptor type 1-like isoform X2 [Podarcis raffonei]|nr:complement receptor type 1-like isoform X2 [Podarcis raffonei]
MADLPNFTFSEVYEELTGFAVIYQCIDGAVRLPGKSTVTYCLDGSWTKLEEPCKPVICENPGVQNGIELSGLRDSYTYGNSVTLECKTGYFMIGNHYILCEKNGTWVPKVPSCKKITPHICGAPVVSKGHVYPLLSEYNVGDVIDVYCNQNYSFIDETTKMSVRCQGYNQWDPSIPLCLAKASPDTSEFYIHNGRITKGVKQYYTPGDEISIQCNAGYTLFGPSTITYIGGSKWSPNIPVCKLSIFLRLLIAACILPVVLVASKMVHRKCCSQERFLIRFTLTPPFPSSLMVKREQEREQERAATKEGILLPETLEESMAKFELEHQKENGRQQEKLVSFSKLPINTTKEATDEANPTSSLHEEGPISESNWVDSAYFLFLFLLVLLTLNTPIHVKRQRQSSAEMLSKGHCTKCTSRIS